MTLSTQQQAIVSHRIASTLDASCSRLAPGIAPSHLPVAPPLHSVNEHAPQLAATTDTATPIFSIVATDAFCFDLILKTVAAAFSDVPEANVIWTPEELRRYSDVDISVVVATDNGLVTPVVRAVNQMNLNRWNFLSHESRYVRNR